MKIHILSWFTTISSLHLHLHPRVKRGYYTMHTSNIIDSFNFIVHYSNMEHINNGSLTLYNLLL